MSFVRTAFFVKNVPGWERVLRLVAAVATVVLAFVSLRAPWSFVVAASGIGFALTGLVGFCPMCALAGRRLDRPR